MPAPYSGRAVANYFLARDHLTQVKLHKLLYYSHYWHFGLRDAPIGRDSGGMALRPGRALHLSRVRPLPVRAFRPPGHGIRSDQRELDRPTS